VAGSTAKAPPVLADRLNSVFSLRQPWLFIACLLASVLPLWLTPYLPFVDVPQHAAQVASLHELLRGNPAFTAEFEINWFTPYLAGYMLLFAASSVLPIVAATKLVLSLALVAIPLVTGMLLRETGADERLKWLAIPGSWSFALYWGFFVYVVAVPVAIFFLVLTVRFERNPTLLGGLGVSAFAVLLFFSHAMALGFGSLLCLAYLLGKNWRTPRRLVACALPYTVPLPIIALWMSRMYSTEAAVRDTTIVFQSVRAHLLTLFTQLAGLDGFSFLASVAVVAAILFLPFATGSRLSRRPERWLPFAIGVAVYFVFPSYAQGTAYLYQRLAVFLVPLWLLIWDVPPKPSRVFGPIVLSVLAIWCGVNGERFASFGREARAFADVLANAQPGHRLAGMMVCNASRYFSNPVYLHFSAWYQAVDAGIADMSFATTHPSIVRYRDMHQMRYGERLAWLPTEFVWTRDAGETYDYYLVCAPVDASAALFKDHATSVALVSQEGNWWLYRNTDRLR
jgi:hypothetical protein